MHYRSLLLTLATFALPAGLFGQAAPADTTSDSEILRQFEQRRETTFDRAVGHTEIKAVDSWVTAAADLYRRSDLAWANAEFLKVY